MTSPSAPSIHTPHIPPPPPPQNAYWFYTSSLPIDDPLSPIPTAPPAGKQPPRPFSSYDSGNLETAYQKLLQEQREQKEKRPGKRVEPAKKAVEGHPTLQVNETGDLKIAEGIKVKECDEINSRSPERAPVAVEIPGRSRGDGRAEVSGSAGMQKMDSPMRAGFSMSGGLSSSFGASQSSTPDLNLGTPTAANVNPTRNPFIRSVTAARAASSLPSQSTSVTPTTQRSRAGSVKKPVQEDPPPQKEVPVGVERLHKVLLPSFVMAPIYWSPLNDVASVVRGTWFYKDTMLPVETEIANRLEEGWEEVKAWTEEWDVELQSAVEVGREGEEKVRWMLWDQEAIEKANSRPGTGEATNSIQGFDGELEEEELELGGEGTATPNKKKQLVPELKPPLQETDAKMKPNPWDWVIFANARDAYICRDVMLSFGNRRPLAQIRKGKALGTHVVRGFSEKEWTRIHPPKFKKPAGPKKISPPHKPVTPLATPSLGGPPRREKSFTGGTTRLEDPSSSGEPAPPYPPHITDLFLVIHGIGQKLSERLTSFAFTNATHSLRRLINLELSSPDALLLPHLRADVSIQVLPINWRHGLSFDDGLSETTTSLSPEETFSLDDITPPTIPAVRSLIGDVMLDIPYYLSHHKPKMIAAVTAEANRVFQLWCHYNPSFQARGGRVHIIAHSLGSALAMDILSHQPTFTPPLSNPVALAVSNGAGDTSDPDKHFLFQTTNIFFIGAPVGFFLLLNRTPLRPRLRSPAKPAASAADSIDPALTAGEGVLGCMAVDNVYNIMHPSDPISYRLNPCVDPAYAATLRTAYIPSSLSGGLLNTLTNPFRWTTPTPNAPPHPAKPPILDETQRLPSNLELGTHDWKRESKAERRLYLLNDNGQIDYYLKSGGMDNQYLGMLGAHSGYWESRDFVRCLVGEVGKVIGSEERREDGGGGHGMRGERGRGTVVRGMGVRKKGGYGHGRGV